MHLQCNQCAKHGVHEDANKQVFLLEGTSWCAPHHEEDLDRRAELARESTRNYDIMYRSMEKAFTDPGGSLLLDVIPLKVDNIKLL